MPGFGEGVHHVSDAFSAGIGQLVDDFNGCSVANGVYVVGGHKSLAHFFPGFGFGVAFKIALHALPVYFRQGPAMFAIEGKGACCGRAIHDGHIHFPIIHPPGCAVPYDQKIIALVGKIGTPTDLEPVAGNDSFVFHLAKKRMQDVMDVRGGGM